MCMNPVTRGVPVRGVDQPSELDSLGSHALDMALNLEDEVLYKLLYKAPIFYFSQFFVHPLL